MIEVAFTRYVHCGNHISATEWTEMPAVPCVGDTVHLPIMTDNEPDFIALKVRHVSWANDHKDHPGWHAEVYLS
jgi:hypothetical protein